MEINKLSEEELKVLSMEKNSKGVATRRALKAQKLLCGELVVVSPRSYDDYTGEKYLCDEFFLEKTGYWDN